MSDILAQMKQAHAGLTMKHVPVEFYGWDLHFPPMSMKDRAAIREGIDTSDQTELMISGLIHMARNKDGSKFFDDTPALRAEMHNMPFDLLMQIDRDSAHDWQASAKN